MALVTIELPSLLGPVTGPQRSLEIEADTLAGALDAMIDAQPALRVHVFDETGGLRQHVLCFVNDTNSRWLESMEAPLSDGDTIRIIQAVSGG